MMHCEEQAKVKYQHNSICNIIVVYIVTLVHHAHIKKTAVIGGNTIYVGFDWILLHSIVEDS